MLLFRLIIEILVLAALVIGGLNLVFFTLWIAYFIGALLVNAVRYLAGRPLMQIDDFVEI